MSETTTTFTVILNTPDGQKTITTPTGATVKTNITASQLNNLAKKYGEAFGVGTNVTVSEAYYSDKTKRPIDLS